MDKGLETIYHKLSGLFHTNTSASSSSNASSVPESSTLLPISTFFDRIIPSAATSQNNDRRRSSARMSHQISIKTNDNRVTTHIPKTIPVNIAQQQQQ
jgi:hypothetical protein